MCRGIVVGDSRHTVSYLGIGEATTKADVLPTCCKFSRECFAASVKLAGAQSFLFVAENQQKHC